jgi:hypothetical protein
LWFLSSGLFFLTEQMTKSLLGPLLGILPGVLPKTLLGLLLFLVCAASAAAQPIYHLYGITPLNALVEIDPADPNFEQRVVGTFSPSEMKGLEYDSFRNRILGLDITGQSYLVDQNTAATSSLSDFSPDLDPGFTGLAFDAGASPPHLYVSQNGSDFNSVLRASDMGGLYEISNQFFYSASQLQRGVSIDPSDFALFTLRRDTLNGFDQLTTIEKNQGGEIQSRTITGASNVAGMAFHPLTGVLYATTVDGTLVQLDKTTGAASVLKSYSSNQAVAVGDLAFIPVTPTPTPTPTPTQTPTPTATICPTVSAECGCNQIPIDFDRGTSVCGPADTLTKTTVPEPPEVQVGGRTVTLLLESYSAVSDGKRLDILTSDARANSFSSNDETAEARRKASIRYDVTLKNTASRARDGINKQSRRNQVSFRRLTPGSYTARYRVSIIRNRKVVGASKYSPRTRFKVRTSRR